MLKKLNRTDILIHSLTKLFSLYFLMLFIMFLFRVFFTFYFGEGKVLSKHFGEVVRAFLLGARYDTIIISYLLVPLFFAFTVGAIIKSKRLIKLLLFFGHKWFYLTSLGVIFLLICDMSFYSYFQDHMNILFFGLFEDDTIAVIVSLRKNYPLEIALLAIALFFAFWYWFTRRGFRKMFIKPSITNGNIFSFSFIFLLGLILLAGGVRGTFSALPLSPKYTEISKRHFINQIALNGIVTIQRAFKIRNEFSSGKNSVARMMGYRNNDVHRAYSDFLGFDVSSTDKAQLDQLLIRKTATNPLLDERKPHVVLFIMESFGKFWLKFHSPDLNLLGELEKHLKEDFSFDRFVSADNGTIGSLLTIITNIPNRPQSRFLSESKYLNLKLPTTAHIPYQNRGYETNFIYGGKLGWRDIGKYFSRQGFHNVEGEEHIKDSLKLEGEYGNEWGLYDEHLFDYVYKKLDNSMRPQFIIVMTTTNHPPYEVPKNYRVKPLNVGGELKTRIVREESLIQDRLLSYQYSNDKLGQFLSRIKASPLSDKTIVSFTGDHNFWGFINYQEEESFSKFRVPFYLYIPRDLAPQNYDAKKLGGHQDIMTTLYNISLSQTSYLSFGRNMFSNEDSFAINSAIQASEHGALFQDNFYSFRNRSELISTEAVAGDPELQIFYRSTMALTDFFLEEYLSKEKEEAVLPLAP